MDSKSWFTPEWPTPATVRSLITTRHGGYSQGAYNGFNLGDHVGDDAVAVSANRKLLRQQLPQDPSWLKQVHGAEVVNADRLASVPEADASFTRGAGTACAILTADCVPVLVCDKAGTIVAAAHAGWRGLRAGVIENLITKLGVAPQELLAYLGPAICSEHYQVGLKLRNEFLQHDAGTHFAFKEISGHWHADLYELARHFLQKAGVRNIYGGSYCTYHKPQFYSHRRDGVTGRMASLIWLEIG